MKMCTVRLDCGCDKLVQKEIAQHIKVGSSAKCYEHGNVKVSGVFC